MSPVTKKKANTTKKTAKPAKGKTVAKKAPKTAKKPAVKKEKKVVKKIQEAVTTEIETPIQALVENVATTVVASEEPVKAAEEATVVAAEPVVEQPGLPKVEIPRSITVKDFAVLLNVGVNQVIAELLKNGIMSNINQRLDFDIATILAHDFGFEAVEKKQTDEVNVGEDMNTLLKDDEKNLIPRSAVISVMGNVDHGKTKLLDAIRGTAVMEGEAGGSRKKIGGYQIEKKTKDGQIKTITFLDTPGHHAFTAMRARGAKVTDIAILVVAADDGVKPQTIEAYEHAKAAGVPVVVAITKIDKENANPDRVKKELADIGLAVEEWGGSTVCAEVSAVRKTGIDELLELVLLVADMQDLKANPNRPAIGTIIESRLDPSQGAVATVLIHTGTIRMRDDVVIASAGHGSIFGFSVQIPSAVQKSADQEKVKITTFDVIYHLLDEVQKVLLSMLEPEVRKVIVGRLKVLKIFFDGKGEQVVGGDVTEGKMVKDSFTKIYRGENIVGDMELKTVQLGPEELKEVLAGEQCGLKLKGNVRLLVGDIVECFTQEKLAISLS